MLFHLQRRGLQEENSHEITLVLMMKSLLNKRVRLSRKLVMSFYEAQAASEKTVSRDKDEKDDESKGTENDKDDESKGTEKENDESRGTKNEKDDESKGTEKEKDENVKQPESETDESVAESAADKEKSDIINEASKTEGNDEKAAEDEKTGNEGKEDKGGENADSSAEAPPFSSFQQLSSSQNAFTGLAGTGFSSSTFSFGSISKDGSTIISKSEGSGFPSLQEVPVETGEENEKAVFTADSVLFEFFDGGWKERGKGELKVNVSRDGVEKARLVMRAKGNYSIGEGKDGLSTFALKFKDASIVEEFSVAVTAHKGLSFKLLHLLQPMLSMGWSHCANWLFAGE
ncbi:Nuclear pore complex protein NUP50A [Vitis vinifera]|uniref:Nuclear pore complex protein NUP50A n=1 Tax=Vitis vinifera TaxID=29760 RepID=A0A438HU55_VITVI|nr:Nuclear pore complex protein NUP50A [Vitis vinifera]